MTEPPWREIFPEGRTIFYEGDEPEKFAQEILAEFGFDPSADDRWAPHQFHCPPEHLDAIYGSDRWPMGS
jgi:hypothetical protein